MKKIFNKLNIEKGKVLYSLRSGFILVSELYDNSFRAYTIDIKAPNLKTLIDFKLDTLFTKDEINSLENLSNSEYFNKIKTLFSKPIDKKLIPFLFEIDNSNSLYIQNDGIINNQGFDIIINFEDANDIKVQFLEEYIFTENFVDEHNEDWYYSLMEMIDGYKNEHPQVCKLKNLYIWIKNNFFNNKDNQEQLNKITVNINKKYFNDKLNEEELLEFFIDIMVFKIVDDEASSNLYLDSSVHYGCDCGCGGDMLIDDNYFEKQAEKLTNQRIKIVSNLLNFINIGGCK